MIGDVMTQVDRAHRATTGNLSAINVASIMTLGKWLGLTRKLNDKTIVCASQLRREVVPGVEGLIAMVRSIGGTTYIAGQGALKYDVPEAWAAAGIAWRPYKFLHPSYAHRGTFHSGLSAIDLLAWEGAERAAKLLDEAIR
jgi:hypothetical protein